MQEIINMEMPKESSIELAELTLSKMRERLQRYVNDANEAGVQRLTPRIQKFERELEDYRRSN